MRDLSLILMHIALVSNDVVKALMRLFPHLLALFLSYILNPLVQGLERVAITHVIHDQGNSDPPVVHFDHASVHLLTGRVPDEQIQLTQTHDFLEHLLEAKADRISHVVLVESVLGRPDDHRCFADAGIAD